MDNGLIGIFAAKMGTAIQIVLNSIISGLLLSLVAIGFTYIFRVTKVFHLAHGGIYVAGAFSSWWMFSQTNSWILSSLFAFLVISILILLFEKVVYLPMNRMKVNQSISLIASMGLFVIITNAIALLFGNELRVFDFDQINPGYSGFAGNREIFIFKPTTFAISFRLGGIILTSIQMIQFLISIIVIMSFFIYLRFSKSKLTLQSVSDNETISKVFGINTDNERMKVLLSGSILACIAAILKGIEIGIDPQVGMSITLTAAVITILAARMDVILIVGFSIIITLLQNYVEWFLNSQWRDGITFMILLFVILFKTEGIVSYNLRKDRV